MRPAQPVEVPATNKTTNMALSKCRRHFNDRRRVVCEKSIGMELAIERSLGCLARLSMGVSY